MDSSASADRYLRQRRFGPFGDEGQAKLAGSRVLICGCGALGSVIAERLARAGVGHLRIGNHEIKTRLFVFNQLPRLRSVFASLDIVETK